jgi:pimeloyl-ACP methyl ester carboxylesterase
MTKLRRTVSMAAVLLCVVVAAPDWAQARIGIVLLHGKQGTPEMQRGRTVVIGGLADALAGAGYAVERPDMCWSRTRIYDSAYLDCLAEIDAVVARLKAGGSNAIVVMGMSLGGNAVLGYGARRDGLAAIVAIAPAPAPEALVRNNATIADGVTRATAMIAAGKSGERAEFPDVNGGQEFTVQVTPVVYASFFSPDGPANMRANISHLKAPLLVVSGTADRSQKYVASIFAAAPANPANKLVEVPSNHLGTPAAGTASILAWLQALRP